MADLDAELLALADGDSQEEGPEPEDNRVDNVSSDTESPQDTTVGAVVVQPKRASKSKTTAEKGGRKRRNDSEDGEV